MATNNNIPNFHFEPTYHKNLNKKARKVGLSPIEFVFQKMVKNSVKAIKEHKNKTIFNHIYPLSDVQSMIDNSIKTNRLEFTYSSFEAKGFRPSMEDAHFIVNIKEGLLSGLFDGHGGSEVAKFASSYVQNHFSIFLEKCEGNVYATFHLLLKSLDQEVKMNNAWDDTGTTAVICFIDYTTHLIYTATLGDSEANIYRSDNGKSISIPLSCIRDWSCEKEIKRAKKAPHGKLINENQRFVEFNPKKISFEHNKFRINVSRAIGDKISNPKKKTVISCKPKVTVHQIKPKDVVILACDGLKDYVQEHEIVYRVKGDPKEVAQNLVNYAIEIKHSKDNVSVLVVNVS